MPEQLAEFVRRTESSAAEDLH
ncbi:MAG: hypothetical protein QOC66_851, partial [Pseudonocardiales bacterium]|nr:hypothetical protein [Pseudonocardiales bacterium]